MKKNDNSNKRLFLKRLFAYIIDCVLVGSIVLFICAPFLDYDSINALSDSAVEIVEQYEARSIDMDTFVSSASSILYRLSKKQGLISLMTIFFNVLYFVIYQFKNNGQTIGKKILGIKIVSNNSNELTMDNFIFRSFIINSLLIDMIVFAFVVLASENVWFNAANTFISVKYVLLFVTGIMVVFNKNERGLHDLVANTKVVDGK